MDNVIEVICSHGPLSNTTTWTANDACVLNAVDMITSVITTCVYIICSIFIKCSNSRRRAVVEPSGLLPGHTCRALLILVLLLITLTDLSLEILSWQLNRTTLQSWFLLSSSLVPLLAVIAYIIFNRSAEVVYSTGWMIVAAIFQACCSCTKWIQVQNIQDVFQENNLKILLICANGFLLALCSSIDFYAVYFMFVTHRKHYSFPRQRNYDAASYLVSYRHSMATLFSKATFWWLTPLLWQGYRDPLELEDLGNLPAEESAAVQFQKFIEIYETEKVEAANKDRPISLWRCYFRTCWQMFTLGGFLKLLGDMVGLVGPLGIPVIIDYVALIQTENISTKPTYTTIGQWISNGYIMGIIVLLSAIAQGTFSQSSTHIVNVEGIRIKTALQSLIYDKSLRLTSWSVSDSKENELEEEVIMRNKNNEIAIGSDVGAITNLMSEDAFNVMSFFWIGHYVWAIPLKISVLMYLLYRQLGISAIIGGFFCILTMTPLQCIIGKLMSSNSKLILDRTDERLKRTNEILQGIKLIKMNAWEDIYMQKILSSRKSELKLLDKDSLYWALMTFLTHVSSVLVTLVTFGAYFLLEDDEDMFCPGRVFAGLALFNQLTVPLFIFPITVPIIISAVVSTKRLQAFLGLPEATIHHPIGKEFIEFKSRNISLKENNSTKETQRDSLFILGNIQEEEDHDNEHLNNKPSTLPEADSSNTSTDDELEAKETSTVQDNTQNLLFYENNLPKTINKLESRSENVVVKLENCTFCWDTSENRIENFTVKSLSIPEAKLTIIVGKIGSGKSSLLSAILGEMHKQKGIVKWANNCSIAYVAQKPWLLNDTLRDNVLFGEPFKPRRYQRVIRSCALQTDIDLLPKGDLTEIGERGVNLSGGQRQRIAIARALYSSANIIILDDPLSALDYQVGQQVFENGIRRLLIRQKRTCILVTHRLQLLSSASQIIAVENGTVRSVGSLAELEVADKKLTNEWRTILSREALEDKRVSRTAKERWNLFKMVSRFGLQFNNKSEEDTSLVPTQNFIPLRKRTSASYGSKYFAHDMPLPIDECEGDFLDHPPSSRRSSVRRSRTSSKSSGIYGSSTKLHKIASRTTSLQTGIGNEKQTQTQVIRQHSSPIMQQDNGFINSRFSRIRGHTIDSASRETTLLRQILSSATKRTSTQSVENIHLSKDKFVKRLSSAGSIKTVEESSENEHQPVKRIISSVSDVSGDMNDQEESILEIDSNGRLINDEERAYGSIPRQTYLLYFKACGICAAILYLVSAVGWQTLRVYTDVWLSDWTDKVKNLTTIDESSHENEMMQYFSTYGQLSAACIFLSLLASGAGQYAGAKARRTLHNKLLSGLLNSSLHFFEVTPLGRLMNRFSTDMGVVDKKIATSIQRLLQFLFLCFCALLVNTAVTPWFLLIAIPICIIYYVVQKFYRCSSRELQRLDSITRSPVFSHFSETLSGLATIRAFGHQRRFMKSLLLKLDVNTNAFLIMNTSNRWLGIALDYLGGVIVFAAILAALISAWLLPRVVTPALVGLAINYTLLVPIYLNWVVKFLSDMEMYMGAVERIEQYARTPPEQHFNKLLKMAPQFEWWKPKHGEIEFRRVSLCYPGQEQPVISNLNLKIPAGQKIGICGRTGSGKSSLVMGLFQMMDITEGNILIDDVDTAGITSPQTIRSCLSIIPQDVIMFGGTFRENIDPKGIYKDEQLWKSLEVVQLKDFVSSQLGGLDGEVKEGGENLSCGQRQLFCLARAVLQASPCLVMDEATSSVDPATEKALVKAVAEEFKNKTVITIAHRLSTILNYDRIVVLENGTIVEDGTPQELQAKTMGIFSTMLKSADE